MAAPHTPSPFASLSSSMDPFIHTFAYADIEGRSVTWSRRAFVNGIKRRLSLPSLQDERNLNEKSKTIQTVPTGFKIPATSNVNANAVQSGPPAQRRPSFHHSRSNSRRGTASYSHTRTLSIIRESSIDVNVSDLDFTETVTPSHTQPEELKTPHRASLMGMPTELRLMIFTHVFSDWSDPDPLALLSTCRQIHTESSVLAYRSSLFKIHTEHWADHDFFQARYLSLLQPFRVFQVRHLALRMPRGVPYDCYASRHLHVDLARMGFQLETLVLYSLIPRPLPRMSEFGGILEKNLCLWLKQTLYSMPSLKHISILNYESATPTLHDMPSPRLVRMLRSAIFQDIMAECQSFSEQDFQWRTRLTGTDSLESSMSNCTEHEKAFTVYSSKLSRSVEIVFRSSLYLPDYGLEKYVRGAEAGPQKNTETLLRRESLHPDLPVQAFAGLLATKNSSSSSMLLMRRQLSRSQSSSDGGSRRNRLSKAPILRTQSTGSAMAASTSMQVASEHPSQENAEDRRLSRYLTYPVPPEPTKPQSPTGLAKMRMFSRRFSFGSLTAIPPSSA